MTSTIREDIPNFKAGDVLSISVNVREGQKVRQQLFKGTVIARKGSGIAETITVRKISNGVGVERIFPIHSPSIASIKITSYPYFFVLSKIFFLLIIQSFNDITNILIIIILYIKYNNYFLKPIILDPFTW